MMKKNDLISGIRITDMGEGGMGVGHLDRFPLFIRHALPGDIVKARILKVKKTYAFARIEELEQPSPDRVPPFCEVSSRCGGCQLCGLSYPAQLDLKGNRLKETLIRLGGFSAEELSRCMEPVLPSPKQLRYRNKGIYPLAKTAEGKLVTGFYAPRSHRVVPVSDCLLAPAAFAEVLKELLRLLDAEGLSVYREETGTGLLRHLLLRRGERSGELQVLLIVNVDKLPGEKALTEKLSRIKGITSFSISENRRRDNVILGASFRTLFGKARIEDSLRVALPGVEDAFDAAAVSAAATIGADAPGVIEAPTACDADSPGAFGLAAGCGAAAPGVSEAAAGRGTDATGVLGTADAADAKAAPPTLRFLLSPLSFYQVNSPQAEALYSLALAYAGLSGNETVWDLYCGIGTISLFLAKLARQVIGIEENPAAIEDAKENARLNHIGNVSFYAGKAEELLADVFNAAGASGLAGNPGSTSASSGSPECSSAAAGSLEDSAAATGSLEDSAAATGSLECSSTAAGSPELPSGSPGSAPDSVSDAGKGALRCRLPAPDVVVLDPPRAGLKEAVISAVVNASPERIVYISCNPATLSRDLKLFRARGYVAARIRGVDMFPQTEHIETIVLLQKLNS